MQPESLWPNFGLGEIPDENLELKKEISANFTDVSACPESSQRKPMPESPTGERTLQWMISNSSDWDNLIRKLAWLIRFTQFVRDAKEVRIRCLTVEDYEAATLAVARITQPSAYKQQIKDLETKGIVRSNSHIANLNPVLDSDGVLRVKALVQRPSVTDAARQHISLPKEALGNFPDNPPYLQDDRALRS